MLYFIKTCLMWPSELLMACFHACFDTLFDGLLLTGLVSKTSSAKTSRREERRYLQKISRRERRDFRHAINRSRRKRRQLRDPQARNQEFAKNHRFSRGKVISHLSAMNRSDRTRT